MLERIFTWMHLPHEHVILVLIKQKLLIWSRKLQNMLKNVSFLHFCFLLKVYDKNIWRHRKVIATGGCWNYFITCNYVLYNQTKLKNDTVPVIVFICLCTNNIYLKIAKWQQSFVAYLVTSFRQEKGAMHWPVHHSILG